MNDEVMKAVQIYRKALDQCINFENSYIRFSKRVSDYVKKTIKTSFKIDNEGGMGSYLGIREDISGSNCKFFAFLKDRLQHRVNGWYAHGYQEEGR